jgi:hypothetical protein
LEEFIGVNLIEKPLIMKNSYVSRNWKTLLILLIAVILIAVPLAVKGMIAETLMPFMFFFGFLLLFYIVSRPWRKPLYYIVMTIISAVLFAILFLGGFSILGKLNLPGKSADDLIFSIGFAFFAGIIAGFAGILTYSKNWQRLIYSGVTLSLLALIILLTCLNPPNLKDSLKAGGWIIMGLQLFITAFLMYIGYFNKNAGRLSNVFLMSIAIILIIIPLTAFIIAPGVTLPEIDNSLQVVRENFWKLRVRIFAVIEIIIAVITLIAWQKALWKSK